MNIRWIGILIILIAGLSCMYVIVTNSTSVGSAVSVINDVTITLPTGYVTTEDGSNFCCFFNKDTNETIRVRCFKENTTYIDQYNNQLNSLKYQDDIIVGKHFKNKTLGRIDYENLTTPDNQNRTVVYFDKCNHTFSLKFEHFTNETKKEDDMNFIMKYLKFDFKQNKG